MWVRVSSVLDCPPEGVWEQLQRSALLLEVAAPLVRLVPVGAAFPERWTEGLTLRCRSYLFGFLPLGTRALTFERIDQSAREIQTRESDPLVRRWDHCLRVRPAAGGRTLYTDEIDIDAGLLTPVVWLFAYWFYRHRQMRWRNVARRLRQN
jgi:hypothetical protein